MTRKLRVRVVSAVLVAALLTAFAASPTLSSVAGLGGEALAAECGGSSC